MAVTANPRVQPASDHSLLVSFGAQADVGSVRKLFASLREAALVGVVNLHPAYASLLVDFDPLRVEAEPLQDKIQERLRALPDLEEVAPRLVDIPVCYGGELGPDLEAVATHCGISPTEVIERHAAADYTVAFLGFSPGFPYLSGLDKSLATPRLAAPRTHVPAGSVAIGGAQAGVYPAASPGGWRLIGRTPLVLFDPHRASPALLEMGDRIRFRPITPEEFVAWAG